jgi:hypothetical protein
LVVVLIIDVGYAFRTKQREFEYSCATLKKIRKISEEAKTEAFGPALGGYFLSCLKVTMLKEIGLLKELIDILLDRNGGIEKILDVYDVLVTQSMVLHVSDVVSEIDRTLNNLRMPLRGQVKRTNEPSILEYKEEPIDWIGATFGLDDILGILDTAGGQLTDHGK